MPPDSASQGNSKPGRSPGLLHSRGPVMDDGSWVAEVPVISGCYALMPTREEALAELRRVFDMIAEEYVPGAPHPSARG
jgi:predicted RNase H-like HicB family nuclease